MARQPGVDELSCGALIQVGSLPLDAEQQRDVHHLTLPSGWRSSNAKLLQSLCLQYP